MREQKNGVVVVLPPESGAPGSEELKRTPNPEPRANENLDPEDCRSGSEEGGVGSEVTDGEDG